MRKKEKPRVLNLLSKKVAHGQDRKKSQKIHFHQRFYERVGYVLTEEKYQDILKHVKGDGVFQYRVTDSAGACYHLKYEGMTLKLIYDPFANNLITILPL